MSSMLAQALQGGGGGGPPDLGGPGGPPPQNLDAGPPPDQGAEGGGDVTSLFQNSIEALDVAEAALHAFIQMDPDQIDRAGAGQALQQVLKLKAANQKSAQAGDAKSLSRALQGAPGLPGLGG